jgi:creatinine deaminase
MNQYMSAALDQARRSMAEGGYPIGSVVVRDGDIVGRGRNRFLQSGDPTTHAEMEAIRDVAKHAGGDVEAVLKGATVYTTMMPCEMCAGAIIRFGIARVVVGETRSYTDAGTATLMGRQDIRVEVLEDPECVSVVEQYVEAFPEWTRIMRARTRRRLVL